MNYDGKETFLWRDALTNGGNEDWLHHMYTTEILCAASPYVFVDMNIKRFQYISNKHGRSCADTALKHLYELANSRLKENEYMARVHADDYNLLLSYATEESFRKEFLIPFIDELFEDPSPVFYHNIYLSFGLYFLDSNTCTFYEAQNRAQIARKRCPQLRNRTFSYDIYTPEMYQTYMQFHTITDQVTRARFQNEFIPFIQPKIQLRDETIVGGEVLVRWIDKEGKQIPLSTFLPVLNTNGDIYMIDLYLFKAVCSYLHEAIQNQEHVVPVSFNITNTSLFDEDFLNDYLDIYRQFHISEKLIEFEFMENIRYDYYNQVKQMITAFKNYGFTCSLDDFGSGYSSFNILLENMIDVLKIDRMFFEKPLDEKNKAVITHIVEIAHTMGMKVLAEGIETKEYVDFLKEIECDMVQGYYYYRPMPLQDFRALLAAEGKRKKHEDTV